MKTKWTRVVLVISILVLCVKKGWLALPSISIPSIPSLLLNRALGNINISNPQPQTSKPQIVRVSTDSPDEDIWSEISIPATDRAIKKAPQCNTPKDKFSSLMYVQGLGGKYCNEIFNQDRSKPK